MEMLDVIFAQRYISAYKNWKEGKPITDSWKIAFDFGKVKNSMIMQHLLLGINAHINLDLGIATLETTSFQDEKSKAKCFYKNFNSIVTDFTVVNEILKNSPLL